MAAGVPGGGEEGIVNQISQLFQGRRLTLNSLQRRTEAIFQNFVGHVQESVDTVTTSLADGGELHALLGAQGIDINEYKGYIKSMITVDAGDRREVISTIASKVLLGTSESDKDTPFDLRTEEATQNHLIRFFHTNEVPVIADDTEWQNLLTAAHFYDMPELEAGLLDQKAAAIPTMDRAQLATLYRFILDRFDMASKPNGKGEPLQLFRERIDSKLIWSWLEAGAAAPEPDLLPAVQTFKYPGAHAGFPHDDMTALLMQCPNTRVLDCVHLSQAELDALAGTHGELIELKCIGGTFDTLPPVISNHLQRVELTGCAHLTALHCPEARHVSVMGLLACARPIVAHPDGVIEDLDG